MPARRTAVAATAASTTKASGGRQPVGAFSVEDKIRPKHHLYDWFHVETGREFEDLSPEKVARQHGVREDVLVRHIDEEIQGEHGVLSLPWAMLSVILFALMMLSHEHVDEHRSLSHAIEFDIEENANFAFSAPGNMGHKDMRDVNCFADFWSWMNKGFMPLVGAMDVATSEDSNLDLGSLTSKQKMRYLWHHRKVGPVKLAQERAVEVECIHTDMAKQYGLTCTRSPSVNTFLKPTRGSVSKADFDEERNKTVWLNGYNPHAQQKLKDLESDLWLDPMTNIVQVSFMVYDGDYDMLRLSIVNFLFSRSGHIWKEFTRRSMVLTPYPTIFAWVVDICFYIQVTFLCVCELREIAHSLRKHKDAPLLALKEYAGVWNVVDWIFIVMSYTILGLWIYRASELSVIQTLLLELPQEAQRCVYDCDLYYPDIFDHVNRVGVLISYTRILSSFFPLIVCLRLFKAFSAQPRLAMVTETLRHAMPNLLHYLIVFLSMYGTYAVMGVAFFGREMSSYATLDRAFPSLFMAALGNFDFQEAEVVGRGYAFAFYVAFMVVVVLVMLSMLIAIVMDVYVEVKANALKSETVWKEAHDILRRSWQNYRKTRLPLPFIIKNLDPNSKEVVTVESFLFRVPGLLRNQAERLITESVREYHSEQHQQPDNLDVKHFTDDIIHKLAPAVGIQDMVGQSEGAEASPDEWSPRSSETPPLEEENGTQENGTKFFCVDKQAQAKNLNALPLEDVLRLAALKLDSGCAVPPYPGSQEAIRQVLDSAQELVANVVCSVKC